jgi:hypothetical protein
LYTIYDAIRDTLSHPTVSVVHRATATMIFSTARGDLESAKGAAQLLLDSHQIGSPAARSKALRAAAFIAKRAGESDAMVTHLQEAAAIAEQYHLVTHAIRSCGMLAEHYYDWLNFREADAWFARLRSWAALAHDPRLDATNELLGAKLALAAGRPPVERHAFSDHIATTLKTGEAATGLEALAVELHVLTARGSTAFPDRLLQLFYDAFDRSASFGQADYAAFVRYLVESRVDVSDARHRLQLFVDEQRRERGLPPPIVATALSGLQHPLVRR